MLSSLRQLAAALTLLVAAALPAAAQPFPGPFQPAPFPQPFPSPGPLPAPAPFPGSVPFPGPPVALPPLTQIGIDPNLGPICAGLPGLGAAPCEIVQRQIPIEMRATQIFPQLMRTGFDPIQGQICAGPLGPGPCVAVARWIAMQELAQQQIQLQVIGNVPGVGPICAGPLGPGSCEAVRLYLMQATASMPMNPFNLRQVQAVGGSGIAGPNCNGPFGMMPCPMVGQVGLDQLGMTPIPGAGTFGLPGGLNTPQALAAACAQRVALDVGAFAGCVGQQVILPQNEQAVLDCAVSSSDVTAFGKCAAPQLGIRVSEDQKILADCAFRTRGDAQRFAACAGGQFAAGALGPNEQAVLACAASSGANSEAFVACAAPRFLSRQQQAVLDCAVGASDVTSFATCAAPNAGISMSEDQRIVARCAMRSNGDSASFATCAGSAYLANGLGERERAVLGCAASANGDKGRFAGCAAETLFGKNLSREQQIALRCAAESGGDGSVMLGCAAANMFNLQLNPEQQIAVQCVVGTGGQPYAAAGCIASRLTLRELTKCLSDGVGGKGCFGDSNDLVGKNGWVRRTMGQIAGGPNSLINNPGQIWGGDNSFVRNPGQIFGGSNSFVRNPGQIFGGPNSVFNRPSQLLRAPKVRIGGKRICLPWC
ncbi:MAG: hypothetical protein IIZ38_12805 [Sphingomonas sp.]|uniref:hypothetical protein n=1 Tax=Sphingomonas sp. TaxID=28214 RepID=UPI0025D54D0C|nr:hypothetical protein [Sphingomonas sp.]MBQ1499186.1 hypothetical protein [Sphingomonas sp.]